MAEAFAALSIAANIAQFVDYAKQVILSGKEIYNSRDGARDEHQALKVIIENIKNSTDEFQPASSSTNLSTDEVLFRKLAAECKPVAEKLLAMLKDLEVPSDVRFRGLQTMRQTFRVAAKKKDIQDLERRLTTIDVQLRDGAARMLQKKHYTGITSAINSLNQTSERLKMNTDLRLEEMKRDLLRTLQNQWDRVEKEKLTHLDNLSRELCTLAEEGQQVAQRQAILQTLLFEEILQREETIKDAHKATLDWMYEKDDIKFVEWLEFERGIYWVKGKAGSGKSTLMKYICNHEITLEILRRWAGTEQLFTASFFFWNSGYPMQRSQVGLLQSLLYQVLRACPTLIMQACPWKVLGEPWTRKELFEALNAVSKQKTLPGKFCFFVDGLDEYEGDDEDIITLLQALASSPNVKICVSSRPWNAFLDAFDDSEWKLVLEDLTSNDMRNYVQTMLVQNEAYRKISEEDPRCQTLVPQIAQRAQGVWLWVYLVVRDLLRDLKAEEEYPLLQRRLDSFPSELERYFENIINRIDSIHREEAARIFLVAITAFHPVRLLGLHFLNMESTDKDYAIHMEISRTRAQDIVRIHKRWKKLLNSRCSDLLEVGYFLYHDATVNLSHRTVGDYLRNNYYNELRRSAGEGFDPRSSLCKIIIALSKVRFGGVNESLYKDNQSLYDFFDQATVNDMLCYARDYEQIEAQSMTVLLDEFDSVYASLNNDSHVHWTKKYLGRSNTSCSFLALAIEYGLRIYLQEKLEMNQMLITQKSGRPLLDYACWPGDGVGKMLDPEIVRLLLEHGSDPNQPVDATAGEHTVWELFVLRCFEREFVDDQFRKKCYEITELMIDHGANPGLKIQVVIGSIRRGRRPVKTATPRTRKGIREGAILSEQTVWQHIFGVERAVRLVSRMEEYAQRNAPPPSPSPAPPQPSSPSLPPPSLLWRLLGWI